MIESTTDDAELVLAVDTELGPWRIGIVGLFIVSLVLVFLFFNLIIPSDGFNLLAAILSLVVTALGLQYIEKYINARFSNRSVQIDKQSVRLVKKGEVKNSVNTTQHVNVLLWSFKITRRARVSKGWSMIACALEQNDQYVVIYTFVSPKDLDMLAFGKHFTPLQSKRERSDMLDSRDSLRLAGEQRRLHEAESVRWYEGAEMSKEDFNSYLEYLHQNFPQWMPTHN